MIRWIRTGTSPLIGIFRPSTQEATRCAHVLVSFSYPQFLVLLPVSIPAGAVEGRFRNATPLLLAISMIQLFHDPPPRG